MKFLWGVIFAYKGIDVTIIYMKKGKCIQGQEIPFEKCLELTPQPFPTQIYAGKGNAPFTRQRHDCILWLKQFAIMFWLVEEFIQTH